MFPILPFPKKFISPFIRQFPLSSAKQYICPSCFGTTFIIPLTFLNFPPISYNLRVFYTLYVFSFPPNSTMMHLCITQCTHWTPLRTQGNNAALINGQCQNSLWRKLISTLHWG